MENHMTVLLRENAKHPTDKLTIKYHNQRDGAPHEHDCFELAYVTSGSALHLLEGNPISLKKGNYYIIDHGSIHRYTQCKNIKLINCLFLADIIDASLSNCTSFDELMKVCMIRFYKQYWGFSPVNYVFYDEDGQILHLLEEIMDEYEHRNIGYKELFRGKLMEILILTMRKVAKEQGEVSIEKLTDNTVIREAVRYFEENYKDKALLNTFCEKNHYNQQYISRRFKKETGITAVEYLHRIRIKKSCNLLVGSNLPICEIASQVGYEDVKFFNKIFQRTVNMTPNEYRKTSQLLQ